MEETTLPQARALRVLVFVSLRFFEEKWDEHFSALFSPDVPLPEITFYFKNNAHFGDAAARLAAKHSPRLKLAEDCAQEFHLAVCVGGDGSMLWLNQFFANHPPVPVIAINTGHVGFLTQFRIEDLPRIAAALATCGQPGAIARDYELVAVPRIECAIGGGDQPVLRSSAINEVAIKSTNEYYRRFNVYVDDALVMSLDCDGLIISSQAGSTAYNAALRGPLLAPGVEALIVSAIAPFACNFRAVVVAKGQTVRVEIGGRLQSEVLVHCDSVRCDRAYLGREVVMSLGPPAFELVCADHFGNWVAKTRSLFGL